VTPGHNVPPPVTPVRPRILILTVSHGASHRQTSKALRESLLEIRRDLTVEIEDALDHCPRWFRTYYDSYLIPLRDAPALWGWIEGVQHRSSSTGPGWLYRRGGERLFEYIRSFSPDVVVATEVGVLELTAEYKRRANAGFRLVAAVTGFDLDRAWVRPEVDLYAVLPVEVPETLQSQGVPPGKILSCGVPVDPAFSFIEDRTAIRRRLAVDPGVPLLLVLFGGTGFGNPRRIIRELAKIPQAVQTVFVAGRNPSLRKNLERLSVQLRHARVLGWIDNLHEWMAAADLAIGKPGASTLVESVDSGLPLLAFEPLPGNERRACDFIRRRQIGDWAMRASDLAPAVTRLLANTEQLRSMRRNALALARPHAAYEVAEAVLNLISGGSRIS
jgi:processive 1,2-diacylglycerol beta-glucosyltransferase